MKILVLWADDRSPNLGVRVLGAGTAALARRVWPDAEFVFSNYGSRTAPVRLGSTTDLLKEAVTRRGGLNRWFASFDLVLDTRAGDSFADIYGLPRLTSMTLATELAHRAGLPVVLTPQTIGPFGGRRAKAMARRSLRTAALVMARDSTSAEAAASLGRPVDLLTSDVVFALDVPARDARRDVVLNVSGLLWQPNPHVDHARYRRTVAEVHDALVAAGRTVTLLPHVLPADNSDDDVPAVEEFAATHAPDAEVYRPTSLDDVRELLAGANLVVGSRMHACLNALSVGTPALPLAYSRKFAPLLGDLGWSHVVDLREGRDDVPATVVDVARRSADLRGEAAEVAARARARLDEAAAALRTRFGGPGTAA